MSLLNRWTRRLPTRSAAMPATSAVATEAEDAGADAAGCGWFDSSHALQSGLLVTEHADAGAVAGDLPLSDWLGLHLAGWPGLPTADAAGALQAG